MAAGDPPQTPHDAPPDPQSWTQAARACGARTLRFAPLGLVPDCSAQIIVTLPPSGHRCHCIAPTQL